MSIPTNRQEFINWCLRKLGEPVIKINVSKEQIEDRVSDAVYKFYERHYSAVEDIFVIKTITTQDLDQGYIETDETIAGVTDVFRPNLTYGATSFEYTSFITDLFGTGTYLTSGNIVYYYQVQSNLTLFNQFFSPEKQYSHNSITNRLTIAGGLRKSYAEDGVVIYRALRKVLGEESITDPSNSQIHNIWKVKWLQDYASALIKKQWASNLGKFQNIQLLGGVQMSGEVLWQQALEEIEKLDEKLMLEHEYPPGMYIG